MLQLYNCTVIVSLFVTIQTLYRYMLYVGSWLEANKQPKARKGVVMQTQKEKTGTVWELPTGKFTAGSGKLWRLLGHRGADIITRLDEDPDFNQRVADFMLNGAILPSVHQEVASLIMGPQNVWLPSDWHQYYGYRLSRKELAKAKEIPFSRETLLWAKDDYFLFYAVPYLKGEDNLLTVWGLWRLVRGSSCGGKLEIGPWLRNNRFDCLDTETLSGWQLVNKSFIPGTLNKSYSEQLNKLAQHLEPPSAIQEAMKTVLLYMKTGQQVPSRQCVRTRSQLGTHDDRCITVGTDPRYYETTKPLRELSLYVYWSHCEHQSWMKQDDYVQKPFLGMGASVKPNIS